MAPPTLIGLVVADNAMVLLVTPLIGVNDATTSFVYASMVVPYACETITPLFKLVLLYTMFAFELLS
jgi:hypothetical protein